METGACIVAASNSMDCTGAKQISFWIEVHFKISQNLLNIDQLLWYTWKRNRSGHLKQAHPNPHTPPVSPGSFAFPVHVLQASNASFHFWTTESLLSKPFIAVDPEGFPGWSILPNCMPRLHHLRTCNAANHQPVGGRASTSTRDHTLPRPVTFWINAVLTDQLPHIHLHLQKSEIPIPTRRGRCFLCHPIRRSARCDK